MLILVTHFDPFTVCDKFKMGFGYILTCQLGFADSDGRLTGSDAIKFFSMSGLSRQDLKQVRCCIYLFIFFLVCRMV